MTLTQWLYRHGIHAHAQNLDRDGRGSIWKSGRAWIRWTVGDRNTGDQYRELLEINPEWNFKLQNRAGAGIAVGGGDSDRELQFNLSLPVGSFYLTFDALPRCIVNRILPGTWVDGLRGRPFKMTEQHELSLNWHDNALWWYGWSSTMSWRASDPWWRQGSFHPIDFLLGRTKFSSETLSEHQVEIPMPERTYPAKVTLTEDSWTRPRWPRAQRMKRASVEMERPIPHPGKGENSWDCDDDALESMTCPARSVADAIAAVVAAVYRSRLRYGGANWRPAEATV